MSAAAFPATSSGNPHHRQLNSIPPRRTTFVGSRRGGIVIFGLITAFCLLNVYRSTTLSDRITGAHEYLQLREAGVDQPKAKAVVPSTSVRLDQATKPAAAGQVVDRFAMVRGVHADQFPEYNVKAADGRSRTVPLWQRRLSRRNYSLAVDGNDDDVIGSYYFLTELLQVRIYAADKARWTTAELLQWLHFLFLAGVEHVYVCDHFWDPAERLDAGPLRRYIAAGLVTYLPWSSMGRDPITAQTRCYQRLVDRYRRRHRWQIAVDIDEYPFAPNDTDENFLVRFLESLPDDVSEVEMPNYLMLGRGDRLHSRTVIERIVRSTPQPANDLVKPIYRPDRLRGASVHHNRLESGRRLSPAPDRLKMLHYWGGRGQDWGPDTPKILATTVPMTAMRDAWSRRLENSLMVFGETGAFSNETGP